MFKNAIEEIEKCLYGIHNTTIVAGRTYTSQGTGFAINETQIITNAHTFKFKDVLGNIQNHVKYEVILDANIGGSMIKANLIHVDYISDIAVLEVEAIPNYVRFSSHNPDIGIHVGALGYPNTKVTFGQRNLVTFNKRFKGSFVSTYNNQTEIVFTDQEMYPGTSGCPIFKESGEVCAMHFKNELDTNGNRIDIALNISVEKIKTILNNFGVNYY